MNLTFYLSPTDPLLLLTNGSTDFTEMVSFPGFSITVKDAVLKKETGELVVLFDYS